MTQPAKFARYQPATAIGLATRLHVHDFFTNGLRTRTSDDGPPTTDAIIWPRASNVRQGASAGFARREGPGKAGQGPYFVDRPAKAEQGPCLAPHE